MSGKSGAVSAVVLAGLMFGLAGCEGSMTIDNSTGAPQEMKAGASQLVARGDSPIVDVPAPIGFSLKQSKSDGQMVGNVRYVNHYYTGRKSKDRVARFYREQMQANHKWRLDSIRDSHGVWRLHFGKGAERCSISISDNWWGTTTIYVEVYPVASS